jgi:hypothetical protein
MTDTSTGKKNGGADVPRYVIKRSHILREIARLAVLCYPDVLVKWQEYVAEAQAHKAELLTKCASSGNADYHAHRLQS